jgi:hypothetical protein
MTERISGNRADKNARNIIDRPNGMSVDDYKKAMGWSNANWAWEFLRRNQAFQDDCKAAAKGGRAMQKRVAAKWHLKAFKHAKENYHGQSGKPRFAHTTLRAKVGSADLDPAKNVLQLMPGELGLALRIDLLDSKLAVRYWVNRLEKAITRRLPVKLSGRDQAINAENLLELLRLLDARKANVGWLALANAIFPRDADDPDNHTYTNAREAKETLKGRKEKAEQLLAKDYIYLALATEKLKVKPRAEFLASLQTRPESAKTA